MSSNYWKIKIGAATAVTFASLDLQALKFSGKVQASSGVSFRQVNAYDSDPLVDYLTVVKIYRDDQLWFQGLCTVIARHGSGQGEYINYTISDPWWQLENVIYQQTYSRYVGGVAATSELARIILGSDSDGSRLHSGEVITATLNYALGKLASDALFQIGIIDVATQMPYEELNAQGCAAIVKRCLRWNPDTVAYFDYSTSPSTLHIRKRANLSTKVFSLSSNVVVSNSINPQYASQKDGVVIQFERTDTIDGNERTITIEDSAGDTSKEFKTLRLFFNLQGGSVSYVRQKVVTQTIQKDSSSWWETHHPKLQNATSISVANATKVALDDGTENDGTSYTKELVSGSIASWMGGVGVNTQIITAEVGYTDSAGTVHAPDPEKKLRLSVQGTNANNQIYSTVGNESPAESTPTGLATAILASINQLQYSGSVQLAESEAGADSLLSKKINITGGRAEWSTMAAQPSAVEIDIDAGVTKIDFGPAQHLTSSDLFQLLRNVKDRKSASGAVRAQIGGTNDLPTRSPNTTTADDGGSNAETPPLNAYWTDKSNSELKVKPGTVDGVEVTGTAAVLTAANAWLKVTLSAEGGAVSTAEVVASNPGTDTATVASRKIYSVTGTAPNQDINNYLAGSQDHDSCGTDHSLILS